MGKEELIIIFVFIPMFFSTVVYAVSELIENVIKANKKHEEHNKTGRKGTK